MNGLRKPANSLTTDSEFRLIYGLENTEHLRRKRRRLWQTSLVGTSLIIATFVYLGLSDAGYVLPGSHSIRIQLDLMEASVFRPIPDIADVRKTAHKMRKKLIAGLINTQGERGRFYYIMNRRGDEDNWTTAQSLSALLGAPELSHEHSAIMQSGFNTMFQEPFLISKNGRLELWSYMSGDPPNGNVSLWMLLAVAQGLKREELFEESFESTLNGYSEIANEIALQFNPLEDGGWNVFPEQDDPSFHNFYTTNLALLSFLHVFETGAYKNENEERLLKSIKRTRDYLIRHYTSNVKLPGWSRYPGDPDEDIFEGLTLQIYSNLLHSERITQTPLSEEMIHNISRHVIKTAERDISHPFKSAQFWVRIGGVEKQARVRFLWYPWSIRSGIMLLKRMENEKVQTVEHVRVRRALGKLIVQLGENFVVKYLGGPTYQAAELLFCLSKIN